MNPVTNTDARARHAATPEEKRRIWMIGLGALAAIVVMLALYSRWSSAQPSTRTEVSAAMGRLDPACRAVARLRIRSRLIHDGRPLTRHELSEMTGGIEHCDEINQQLAGADDAA